MRRNILSKNLLRVCQNEKRGKRRGEEVRGRKGKRMLARLYLQEMKVLGICSGGTGRPGLSAGKERNIHSQDPSRTPHWKGRLAQS